MAIAFERDGIIAELSKEFPLPVQQTLPAVDNIQRYAYSGSVAYNTTATMHGGSVGTPTVVGVAGAKLVIVAIQHRMASAAQSGNKVRVRRRYVAPDGSPYTVWPSAYNDFAFNSGTTDDTAVFVIASSNDATNPPADELEISIQNVSTTTGNTLTWQAVVLVVK